jgi:RNA polymerase sigma factor (sigma-70 family)
VNKRLHQHFLQKVLHFSKYGNKHIDIVSNPAMQATIVTQLQQEDIIEPLQFLYQNYYAGVASMLYNNGCTTEDVADIFQETVLTLADKVKSNKFRGESSIKTFIIAVARNLWLHEMRTKGRRNKREMHYMSTSETVVDGTERMFNKANTDNMKIIFEAVGDVCTQILTGYYYDNLSMRELLQKFNYENEQVLGNRKSKCMKKLKELLTTNIPLLEQFKTLCIYGA